MATDGPQCVALQYGRPILTNATVFTELCSLGFNLCASHMTIRNADYWKEEGLLGESFKVHSLLASDTGIVSHSFSNMFTIRRLPGDLMQKNGPGNLCKWVTNCRNSLFKSYLVFL